MNPANCAASAAGAVSPIAARSAGPLPLATVTVEVRRVVVQPHERVGQVRPVRVLQPPLAAPVLAVRLSPKNWALRNTVMHTTTDEHTQLCCMMSLRTRRLLHGTAVPTAAVQQNASRRPAGL